MENHPIFYIILGLIFLFTIFLIIIYTKGKLNYCPYYFNIFFCLIIFLYHSIRLILNEINEIKNATTIIVIDILLTLFDKLILIFTSSYSIIYCLDIYNNTFYKKNIKTIYIVLISFDLTLAIILALSYNFYIHFYDDYTSNDAIRFWDTIFTSILFLISLLFLIFALISAGKMKNNDIKVYYIGRVICYLVFCLFLIYYYLYIFY